MAAQQDWFTQNLSYEDYKDFQNALHYYTLTHTEFVGHRLLYGVQILEQGLKGFDYSTLSYADTISKLIEFCTEFEQLMMSSYRAFFSFYRSMYRFHGVDIEIEVEEILRNTDSRFSELSGALFTEKNLNAHSQKLIGLLLQEQEAIRERLLMTVNQLQVLEKVFLAELEHNPATPMPTIEELIAEILQLLATDSYKEIYDNTVEVMEMIIPTIPMPSEKTSISILSARIINHADYLAMLLDHIGTNYQAPGSTECIMGRWIVANKDQFLHIEAFRKFIEQHEAFHDAAQDLLQKDSFENSRRMLQESMAFLSASIALIIEIKAREG